MDYTRGDYVRYAAAGICQVTDVTRTGREKTLYYVLKPVGNTTMTLYVPAENTALTARLCRVPTKAELVRLIRASAQAGLVWPEDRKVRGEAFRAIIKSSDQTELLKLVSCIYLQREALLARGKKLSATDEGFLKQAENAIESDFAFILDIAPDQVGNYIRTLLSTGES